MKADRATVHSLVHHSHFKSGVKAATRKILGRPFGSVIEICGLSGSGKSEIILVVARELAGTPDQWGVGRLPVAIVRASKEDRGRFNAKAFAAKMLVTCWPIFGPIES